MPDLYGITSMEPLISCALSKAKIWALGMGAEFLEFTHRSPDLLYSVQKGKSGHLESACRK